MVSTLLGRDFVSFVDDLLAVAIRDAVSAGRMASTMAPVAARDALIDELGPLIREYAEMGGQFSADWYDEVRADSRASGSFRASVSGVPNADQTDSMIRWAVGPLFVDDVDLFVTNLARGSERLVQQPTRSTVVDSSWSDPSAGAFVRNARTDACPFCLMLASRGAVFQSRSSAETVGTGRLRGSRQVGQSYHDNCRCYASPVFSPADVPTFNQSLAAEWRDVTDGLSGVDARRAWDQHFRLTRT